METLNASGIDDKTHNLVVDRRRATRHPNRAKPDSNNVSTAPIAPPPEPLPADTETIDYCGPGGALLFSKSRVSALQDRPGFKGVQKLLANALPIEQPQAGFNV